MMVWLLIAMLVGVGWFLWQSKKRVDKMSQQTPLAPKVIAPVMEAVQAPESEDDELLAIFAASVAEFEGTGEFHVVSIKPSGRNWALTARQDLLRWQV